MIAGKEGDLPNILGTEFWPCCTY